MQIKPGAVGIVDAYSGDFSLVTENLPGVGERVKDIPSSNTWQLSSVEVTREESEVKLDGTYVDPESGTKIDAGLEVKWGFAKAGSIVSEFSLSHESIVEDFGTLLDQNMDWLADKAKSVGMGSDRNIDQGFGMVTSVLWANSGLNIGSQENKSDFSIVGSISGINEMLGVARQARVPTFQPSSRRVWIGTCGRTSLTPRRLILCRSLTRSPHSMSDSSSLTGP